MANVKKFLFFDPVTGAYSEQTSTDTIQIANGVNSADAVNKGQLDAVATAASEAVAAEEARALAAEAALQASIDVVASDLADEVARATAAEQGIAADLAQEVLDREAAVSAEAAARAAAVSAEQSRAEGVEASLRADLNTEISDRTAAVLAEKTRAEGVEASLLAAINQEITDRTQAVADEASARAAADAAELSRAQAAEADLQDQITQEVADRQAAISALNTSLSNAISAEEAARIAADADLQGQLDAEEAARIAGDADLQTQLDAEIARATAAEGVLTSNLNTEIAAREAAVTAEAVARQLADDGLSADIAAEETRALGREAELQASIDAEVAAREAAIVAEAAARVQGDADTLASANAYSDALVQGLKVKDPVRFALAWKFDMEGSTITLPADFSSIAAQVGAEAGDRILLLNSDAYGTSVDEGIYVVAAGGTSLVRAADMAVGADASGAYTYVEEGIYGTAIPFALPGTGFVCQNVKGSDTVGTDALSWAIWSRAENLTFSGGVEKTGLDVSLKFAENAPFTQDNGLALEMDGDYFTSTAGILTMQGILVDGPMGIADDKHGHSRASDVRPGTGASEAHFAKFNGDSATWDSSSCMAFVESKDGSNNALLVYSGKGKHSALSAALAAFSVGETLYVGEFGGEFVSFAGVPSGKWAIPVGRKLASDAMIVAIGTALLKA